MTGNKKRTNKDVNDIWNVEKIIEELGTKFQQKFDLIQVETLRPTKASKEVSSSGSPNDSSGGGDDDEEVGNSDNEKPQILSSHILGCKPPDDLVEDVFTSDKHIFRKKSWNSSDLEVKKLS